MKNLLAVGCALSIALLLLFSEHAQEREPKAIGIAAVLCLVIAAVSLMKGARNV